MKIREMGLTNLKEFLLYDLETGVFTWAVDIYAENNKLTHIKGDRAGHLDQNGYRRINVNSKTYLAHRLAWFYMTGKFPEEQVDHRDLDKDNNKFLNLREATIQQNACNRENKNPLGIKGLSKGSAKRGLHYVACIKFKGEQFRKSKHCTPETEQEVITELTKWLIEMREELHGNFVNHG